MISLYDIIEVSNGQLYGEPGAQIFTDFCVNPSTASPNTLYVTLKNDQGDTHRYIEEAIARGASGVLCTRPPDCDTTGISVVMVRDTVTALMNWAQHVLGKAGVRVIGVTGSTGKSVAVEAISRVLSTRYKVLTSPHEIPDNRLGIPLALAQLSPEHQIVVLRFSPTQPGEMAAMLQAAQPQVGVILTVDHTHTNSFENIDQLANELRLLVEFLPPAGLAAINYDDDRVRAMANSTRAIVTTVGIDSFGANLLAYNVIIGPNGTGFDLRYGSERYIGRWIPIPGKHQLYNILNALIVGRHFDIAIEDGLKVLTELTPLPGRMNTLIGVNDAILIDDTHSATPQSTLAALDWLASARDPKQRVIFVLGDMDHLGTHSQPGHRQIGQRATEVVDIFITQGMEAAAAARAALDSGMDAQKIHTTYSTHDTIYALLHRFKLTPHDLVLIKGGASRRMEQVVQALLKDTGDRVHLVRQAMEMEVVQLFQPTRPTWVEIDTDALAGNVRAIKKHIGQDVALMAVVKADAYGHGAVVTAQTALLNGATYLGVANLEEALQLRNAGIDAPILILSYTPIYAVREAIRHNLTITVYDLDMARAYDRAAREVGGRVRVHAKIDTGMGRLGVLPDDAMPLFRNLNTLQYIDLEGIYTHFATADADPDYVREQLTTFRSILRPLRAAGIEFKYTHAANSAATLTLPETHFNMVRCGMLLYGLPPGEEIQLSADFKPAMTWKTIVAQVKQLPPGSPVGYGNTYRTSREETIAVLPVGYADGLRRDPHQGEVLIQGQRAPIVGRVSMEKTMVNVTNIAGVSIGDEVVLLGRQGDQAITAEEIAAKLGTLNYEVITSIMARVPRR